MRLTLRTLIAWLDDTLTSAEVRTIGQQVSESPFAKELVERVQRVTRQRRLTYPGDLNSAPTDPNLVACYLDNELPAEQVAEFEKVCLTSDVHLAEVASVHQVLSLIGQKAKVPPDARNRMYRLVRGRETVKPPTPPKTPKKPVAATKPPVSEPIAAWSSNVPTHRSFLERFGPAAAVLALIVVLALTAINSLRPDSSGSPLAQNNPAVIADKVKPAENPKPENPPVVVPATTPTTPSPVNASTNPEAMAKAEAAKGEDVPEEVGQFAEIHGVVLKPGAEPGAWDRIEARFPLKEGLRLINLAPFRNSLKLGKSEIDLVDSTDVAIDNAEKDQPPRFELKRGQLVVRSGSTTVPVVIRADDQVLEITAPLGSIVGVERIPTLMPGQSVPAPPRLRIYVPEGRVDLKAGEAKETLNGPAEVSFLLDGKFEAKGRQPIPSWVSETSPSVYSKEVGNQFAKLLRLDRPILADLVEAMDDEVKDVKRMAVKALGAIGAMEQVVEVVSRKEDPTVHHEGVEVLRMGLAQGGDTAKSVREALVRQFDQPWAEVTEKLIIGFSPEEAKSEVTLVKLVEYLSASPSRGTRQLALDNLKTLMNRDNLEYDPDNPEGKGLKAWQDLVRKKEPTKGGRPLGGGGGKG
jgi:hypothetical protein